MFCLSVCFFGDFVLFENFSLIWRRYHYRLRASNMYLCSSIKCMAFEQWGFFDVSHLFWHWASVYSGNLWGPVTLAPISKCLAVELSLSFLLLIGLAGIRTPDLSFAGRTLVIFALKIFKKNLKVVNVYSLYSFYYPW